jgi:hypothetical protein
MPDSALSSPRGASSNPGARARPSNEPRHAPPAAEICAVQTSYRRTPLRRGPTETPEQRKRYGSSRSDCRWCPKRPPAAPPSGTTLPTRGAVEAWAAGCGRMRQQGRRPPRERSHPRPRFVGNPLRAYSLLQSLLTPCGFQRQNQPSSSAKGPIPTRHDTLVAWQQGPRQPSEHRATSWWRMAISAVNLIPNLAVQVWSGMPPAQCQARS